MGGKRKPFITTKAINEAIYKSLIASNWQQSLILELWELASLHLTEEVCRRAFKDVIVRPGVSALFERNAYKITGKEVIRFDCPPGSLSNPCYILSDMLRELIKRDWPLIKEPGPRCDWYDFSDALLEILLRQGFASRRLKIKKLEDDLGM